MFMGSITELGIAFADLIENQADWSRATFGTDDKRGPLGPLKHLAKEVQETIEAWNLETGSFGLEKSQAPNGAWIGPEELHIKTKMEMADLLILVLDASRRAGIKPMQLIEAAQSKMVENKKRTWPQASSDEPVEHIREVKNETDEGK